MRRKETDTKKRYRWALWAGLFLFVVGDIVNVFFIDVEDTVGGTIDMDGYSFMMLLSMLLSAAAEEIICRGWTLKKKAFTWITMAAMALWTMSSANVFVGLAAALALALILALPQLDKYRTVSLLLSTSLVFALLHLGRYPNLSFTVLVPLTADFGFGLVMCYFAINYSLVHSIVIHGGFNFVIFCIGALGMFAEQAVPKSVSLENERLSCVATADGQHPGWKFDAADSTIHCHATKGGLVSYLMDEYHEACGLDVGHMPVIYQYPQYGEPGVHGYDFIIKYKPDTISRMDYGDIVRDLERIGLFSLDTSYQPLRVLRVVDEQKAYGNETGRLCVQDVVLALRIDVGIPVVPDTALSIHYPISKRCVSEIERAKTDFDCMAILERYGMTIQTDKREKVQVINVSEPN